MPQGVTSIEEASTGRGTTATGGAGGREAEAATALAKQSTFIGPWHRSPRVRMNLAMDRRETTIRNKVERVAA
jgi:hypothetical protein